MSAVVALAVIVVAVVVVVLTRGGDDSGSASGRSFVEPSSSPTPTQPAKASGSSCPDQVAHSFAPASITVAGVARNITVIAPPRDSHNVPGVPPLSDTGKHEFAFDREQGVRPGDARGNVLLNAHTWPDGSALGNALLQGLHHDGRIVVHGKKRQELCYRVTRRVEVLATAHVPEYYSRTGTPQLAIIVCSGRRLGPEQWEKRTIWYATPSS
jgi:hypothetical protein